MRAEDKIHQLKKSLKEKATTSGEPTKRLACLVKYSLDFECRAKLRCQPKSLKKIARSARATAKRHPANPSSLETPSIPPSYLYSQSGDNLLLWDSGYSSSLRRFFLFGTLDNIYTLAYCNNLIIYGTFKVPPNLLTQLLTVNGLTDDHVSSNSACRNIAC